MKDARGHGSNAGTVTSQAPTFGQRRPQGGGSSQASPYRGVARGTIRDDTSNAEAARALMGALQSTMAPIHPAMQNSSDRAAPGPRPDVTAALRQRNFNGTADWGDNNWGRALKR